jgi:DNA-binding NtrC family response regulator
MRKSIYQHSPHFSAKGGYSPWPLLHPPNLPGHLTTHHKVIQRNVRFGLIVSPQLEVCQVLIRTLDRLSTDVICCSTRTQAEEVLARQEVDLVFCDEYLPDGSYSDLIHSNHWNHKIPRVVVATRHGDWDLYFEAMRKGALDITRSPRHATDVEMILIRALREGFQQAAA